MTDAKIKIYIETTVFNYYYDKDREGHRDVVELFARIKSGEFEAFTSSFTVAELEQSHEPKRSMMTSLLAYVTIFTTDSEMDSLAKTYVDKGIIPSRYQGDASHIAAASVYGLDCIVSYNFKHINRLKTKTETARVNHLFGHKGVFICTAREVISDEEQE